MGALHVPLVNAAPAFLDQAQQFVAECERLADLDLIDPSLARGWSRLDVVVHTRMGLDEMSSSIAAGVTDAAATHDAASYWSSHPDDRDQRPVEHIMWLRRTASAYSEPRSAVRHLRDAAHRAQRAVQSMTSDRIEFQSKVLTTGDFVTTWAVELALHLIDLDTAVTPTSATMVKQTVEAVAGVALPDGDDIAHLLAAATGRRVWPTHVPQPTGYPISL